MGPMNQSSSISKLIPSYYEQSGSVLLKFLKLYYEWSEVEGEFNSDIKSILDNRNIAKQSEELLTFFRQEFAQNIPVAVAADQRLMLQHLVKLYKTKGSERSFKFLFKLLFNESLSITYPYDDVFQTSQAKWTQEKSVFVDGLFEPDYAPTTAYLLQDKIKQYVQIIRIAPVSNTHSQVFFTAPTKNYSNRVKFFMDGVEYPISLSVSSARIIDPGKGFNKGGVYSVQTSAGDECRIKVDRIDENGGILSASFVKFSPDYNTRFTFKLQPISIDVARLQQNSQFQITGDQTYTDSQYQGTKNTVDAGLIVQPNYFPPTYLSDDTYTGIVLGRFQSATDPFMAAGEEVVDIGTATLDIYVGPVANFPGYYRDSVGFTSDFSVLQDSNFYQRFSYLLRSELRLEDFFNAVMDNVHPAGFKMFAEYSINTKLNLGISVESILSILRIILEDEAFTSDDVFRAISKALTDTATTLDQPAKFITKAPFTDTVNQPTDDNFKNTGKVFTETQPTADGINTKNTGKVLQDTATTAEDRVLSTTKVLADTATTADDRVLSTTKVLADTQSTADAIDRKDVDKVLADTAAAADAAAKTTGKALTDTQPTADGINTIAFAKVSTDVATSTDDKVLSTTKVLTDSSVITDSNQLSTTKVLVDNQPTADTQILSTTKGLADTATTTDVKEYSLTRPLADSTTVTDQPAITTTKPAFDSSTTSDTQDITLVKIVQETIVSADQVNQISTGKTVADSTTGTDAVDLKLVQKALVETAVTSHTEIFAVNKVLADSVSVTDNTDVAAGRDTIETMITSDQINQISTGKGLSDSTNPTDAIDFRSVQKVLSDNTTTSHTEIFAVNKVLADTAPTSDQPAISTTKAPFSDIVNQPTDNTAVTATLNKDETILPEDVGGLAADPIYAGNASDGDEFNRRYWQYTYMEGEQVFT